MRNKLIANTILSVILQIVTIISGFVVPRLILQYYGSAVNGQIQSITQFLSIISFLEMGIGSVIQSSLYKAIYQNDNALISKIIKSGKKFFNKIAFVLLIYVFILCFIYPLIIANEFDWLFSCLLILAIGLGAFSQYYFGIVDRLLLNADQKAYIHYSLQIISLILNVIICVVLINSGSPIQLVKILSAIVFLITPLGMRIYISKRYKIDKRICYDEEPIKQKWNGIAQHISSVVLDNTDVIVLTIFSTLTNVSIYSVYHMVIYGVKQLYQSTGEGLKPVVGNLAARNDGSLNKYFPIMEHLLHAAVIFLFLCTGSLILPFVSIYTSGITDANYIQPIFAILLVTANAIHCIRAPYQIIILGEGHYKQTQSCYAISAILNVVVSILFVFLFGLIGVAIGTIVAMSFQTIWLICYTSKNFKYVKIKNTIKQFFIDIIEMTVVIIFVCLLKFNPLDYLSWIVSAVIIAFISFFIVSLISIIFYRKEITAALDILKKRRQA